MKCLLLAVLVACGGGSSTPAADEPAKVDAPYKTDIESLCDVVAKSGSSELDPNDRVFKIATWLSGNLQTQDARKFLSKIQPLKGAAKADALDAEAHRVGLASCALAVEWRKS